MKVLLVEDNQDAAEPLKMILEMNDHQVTIMPDGKEALELVKIDGAEAIILDHFLPNMCGYTFLSELRNSLNRTTIPVIVATGADLDVEKLYEYQPVVLLTKPFDPEHLLGLLDAFSAKSPNTGEVHE